MSFELLMQNVSSIDQLIAKWCLIPRKCSLRHGALLETTVALFLRLSIQAGSEGSRDTSLSHLDSIQVLSFVSQSLRQPSDEEFERPLIQVSHITAMIEWMLPDETEHHLE